MPDSRKGSGLDDEAAPRWVEALIHRAEQARASDIHLHAIGSNVQVSLRLDGYLTPDQEITSPLADRWTMDRRLRALQRGRQPAGRKTERAGRAQGSGRSRPSDGSHRAARAAGGQNEKLMIYLTPIGQPVRLLQHALAGGAERAAELRAACAASTIVVT